jgi:hypothetical protein
MYSIGLHIALKSVIQEVCIWEVLGSDLGLWSSYHADDFVVFLTCLEEMRLPQVGRWPHHFQVVINHLIIQGSIIWAADGVIK